VQNYYGYPGYGNYEQQQAAPQQQPPPAQPAQEEEQQQQQQQQPPQQVGPQQSCVPLNLMPFRVEPGKYTMLKDCLLNHEKITFVGQFHSVILAFVVLHVHMLTFFFD
jgi:hypothetical protein